MVDQSQMSIALLKALVGLAPVEHRVDLHHPPAFRHAEKEKKVKSYSSTVRDCLLAHFSIDAEPPGKRPCMRKRDDIKPVNIGAGCGEEG